MEPAAPPMPLDMVPRRAAMRNHILIFLGTLVSVIFLAEKIVQWRGPH
jgi:hypothetical protein